MSSISEKVVVDVKIVGDKARALEVLRSLEGYRNLETLHLQGCALTDEDIADVHQRNREENRTVKYLCLRDNNLCRPWKTLSQMFGVLDVLDCRGNRLLALPAIRQISNSEEQPMLRSAKEMLIDAWLLGHLKPLTKDTDNAGDTIRKLCPAAAGFDCCPVDKGSSHDNDEVDANEEEGLEHEEELVGESDEEDTEILGQQFCDVFSCAERQKIVKG